MSSKHQGSKKSIPKALDTVVTRKKSAQRMQLRKMDRSMKAITQLLKSPNTSHLQAPPKKLPEKSSNYGHMQLSPKNLPEKSSNTGLQVSPKKIQESSSSHVQASPKKILEQKNNTGQLQSPLKKPTEKILNTGQLQVSPKQLKEKNTSTGHTEASAEKSPVKISNTGHLQLSPRKILRKSSTIKNNSSPNKQHNKNMTGNDEYYPDKLKRKISAKTILMKPKHNMTIIGGTNKRKLGTPQKGYPITTTPESITETPSDSPVYSERCMPEVLTLIEDTQSLNDEDFLEILTCPSPVWWEEPPNDDYTEDAIITRRSSLNSESISDTFNTQTDTNIDITLEKTYNDNLKIGIKNNDIKFTEKRTKLESLLGNIRNKISNNKVTLNSHRVKYNNSVRESNSRIKRNSDSTEGSLFSDISVSEDDLLRDLENIDIPIKTDEYNYKIDSNDYDMNTFLETDKVCLTEREDVKPIVKEMNNILKLEIPTKLPPLKRYPRKRIEKIDSPKSTKSSEDTISNSELDTISDTNIRFIDEEDNDSMNKGNITEIHNASDCNYKPISNIEVSDEKQVFLDTDKTKLITVSKDTESMNDFEDLLDKSELITVYKIMTHNFADIAIGDKTTSKNNYVEASVSGEIRKTGNDSVVIEKETQNRRKHEKKPDSGKLNTFFKKRKKSQNSRKTVNISENNQNKKKTAQRSHGAKKCELCNLHDKSFVVIPDSNKKLCLHCSSIFDVVCTYCVKNNHRGDGKISKCKCQKLRGRGLYKYRCNFCVYGSGAKRTIRTHLLDRHVYEVKGQGSWTNCYTTYV